MTDREKLIALLRATEITKINGHVVQAETCFTPNVFEKFADNLIANTVDAAPVVHGRWDDFCNGKMCCCSACKAEFDNACNEIHGEWKFCPNCGAKMDGGVSDG